MLGRCAGWRGMRGHGADQPIRLNAMNLDAYKDKIDSETLQALSADLAKHTDALEARALKAEDKARKAAQESIDGRKGKDALLAKALEKLGIDSPDELDNLPDAKGQAEAIKQYEIKLKRAERERDEAKQSATEVTGRYQAEKRERAIADQLARHPFADPDVARAVISQSLKQDGDELFFISADGLQVPLADGVAGLVKAKPVLLKPADNGGSGSGFKGAQGGKPGGNKTMSAQDFAALSPKDRAKAVSEGYAIADAT